MSENEKDDLFKMVDRECRDSFEAFLLAIQAEHKVETHAAGCTCGDAGCRRLLAFRRYIRAYLRLKRREQQLKLRDQRAETRVKFDAQDAKLADQLVKDSALIEREVSDAQKERES